MTRARRDGFRPGHQVHGAAGGFSFGNSLPSTLVTTPQPHGTIAMAAAAPFLGAHGTFLAAVATGAQQAEYIHRKHRERNPGHIFPEDIAPHEHLSFKVPQKVSERASSRAACCAAGAARKAPLERGEATAARSAAARRTARSLAPWLALTRPRRSGGRLSAPRGSAIRKGLRQARGAAQVRVVGLCRVRGRGRGRGRGGRDPPRAVCRMAELRARQRGAYVAVARVPRRRLAAEAPQAPAATRSTAHGAIHRAPPYHRRDPTKPRHHLVRRVRPRLPAKAGGQGQGRGGGGVGAADGTTTVALSADDRWSASSPLSPGRPPPPLVRHPPRANRRRRRHLYHH